jgi:hypothetical protein
LDICGHLLPFISSLDKQLALKAFLVEDKAPPPPPPPLGFKQMPILTIAIVDAMGKIFWDYFNAKGDVIKCAVL